MILYSNGCSYTKNLKVDDDQRYPSLLSRQLNWDLMDNGIPGSCNGRILRCTYRDSVKLLNQGKSFFALIQLTHLYRFEYVGEHTEKNHWKYAADDLFESITPATHDIPAQVKTYANGHFALHNDTAEFSKLIANLIGLTAFFKQNNIGYLIYSGPEVPPIDMSQDAMYLYLSKNAGVLDLLNFNMLGITGKQQHPAAEGMQQIANYFYQLLRDFTN